MIGNRGIYHQGWTAVTKHRTPWMADQPPPFDDDVWELYGPDDWTQAHNLAAENPEKLAELQRLWLIEAVKYNVVPLDDRGFERINPDIAGRPQLITRQHARLLFSGMRVSESCVLNMKNKSHSVTANVDGARSPAPTGVIVTQGGSVGGWTPLRARGQAEVLLQLLRHRALHRRGRPSRSRPATHQVRMEFTYDGGGLAKGGDVTLYYDGKAGRQGPGRADPADGLLRRRGLRRRLATPARRPRRTTGPPATSSPARSTGCSIDIGEDSHDHLITAEDTLQHRDGAAVAAHAKPSASPASSAPPSARRTARSSPARRPRRGRGRPAATSSPAPASAPCARPPRGRRVAIEIRNASVSALITSRLLGDLRTDRPLRGGEPR